MILSNYSKKNNFWRVNNTHITHKPFKEIYEDDNSKDKSYSSDVMWAIAFLLERDDNSYINYTEEERKELIYENIMDHNKNFSWNDYEEVIHYWKKNLLTAEDRTILELENKLDERNEFLRTTKYTLDNAKELDTIFANTSKIQDLLHIIKGKRDKKEESINRGGAIESALEKGII